MTAAESAVENILILAVIAALSYLGPKWIGDSLARFRYRRYSSRLERKRSEKLERCKAVIRDYEAADEAAVFALIRENAAVEGVQLDSGWSARWLREATVAANLSVALVDKRIVGYAHWDVFPFGFCRTVANLTELYVQPEHRREGIGSALVAQMTKQAGMFGHEAVNCVYDPQDESASGFFHIVGALPSGLVHRLVPIPPGHILEGGPEVGDDMAITLETSPASQTLH